MLTETFCCLQSTKTDVLREKLEESEKLMSEISKTWEEKLKETEKMHQVSSVRHRRFGMVRLHVLVSLRQPAPPSAKLPPFFLFLF